MLFLSYVFKFAFTHGLLSVQKHSRYMYMYMHTCLIAQRADRRAGFKCGIANSNIERSISKQSKANINETPAKKTPERHPQTENGAQEGGTKLQECPNMVPGGAEESGADVVDVAL